MPKLSVSRIGTELGKYGFEDQRPSFWFVRNSSLSEVYETIQLTFAGRGEEFPSALVRLTIGKNLGPIIEDARITEIDQHQNLSIALKTHSDVLAWEKRFVEIAVPCVERLFKEKGQEVFDTTAEVRNRAHACLQRLDPERDLLPQIAELTRLLPAAKAKDAQRLAEWAGVLHLVGAEDAYLLACLAIEA